MTEKNAERDKKYTICHPVVFAMVMQDAELCRELLQRILPGRKIREMRFTQSEADKEQDDAGMVASQEPETEKTLIVGIEAKSVRLDVLFEDDEAWYDVELQIEEGDCPPKRSRYYQAVKTVAGFKKGAFYSTLKPGYVIFICMFDLFKMNRAVYRFQMFDENLCLPLGDEQYTIFLNGVCSAEIPEELKPFYLYLNHGEVSEEDDFVRRMDSAVQEVIRKEGVRYQVTLYDEMQMWKNGMKAAEADKMAAEADKMAAEEKIERVKQLTAELLKQNRVEDALRVMEDEEFLEKMLVEFEI